MSDDEYYANSPYDDYDDLLWDDGVEGDIAGDLAEHTLHSPVWQDDPGYELQQGFSDWDYYSDDYYDDDPVLLKQNPQDGSPLVDSKKQTRDSVGKVKRGKKRKLMETEDIPALDLNDRRTLDQCVRGTVWAQHIPAIDTSYREGESGKVALLKEWREVFKHPSSKDGKSRSIFGRGQLHRDESWANDMSLEDMGLTTAKRRNTADSADVGDELPQDGEDEDTDIPDEDHDPVSFAEAEFPVNGEFEEIPHPGHAEEPRKRQKTNGTMLPPPSEGQTHHDERLDEAALSPNLLTENKNSKRRGQSQKEELLSASTSNSSGIVTETPSVGLIRTKKRRASSSDEERGEVTRKATVANRAKRVASSKLSMEDTTQEVPPPLPGKRVTRSKKKG